MKFNDPFPFARKIALRIFVCFFLFVVFAATDLFSQTLWLGMSKDDLVFEMGNPKSSMSMGEDEVLFYPNNVRIVVSEDKVSSITGMVYDYTQPSPGKDNQGGVWRYSVDIPVSNDDGFVEEVDPASVEHLVGEVDDSKLLPPQLKSNEPVEDSVIPEALVDEEEPEFIFEEPVSEGMEEDIEFYSGGEIYPEFAPGELSPETEAFLNGEKPKEAPIPWILIVISGVILFIISAVSIKMTCKMAGVEVFFPGLMIITGGDLAIYFLIQMGTSNLGLTHILHSGLLYDFVGVMIWFPLVYKFTSAKKFPTILKVVIPARVICYLLRFAINIFLPLAIAMTITRTAM